MTDPLARALADRVSAATPTTMPPFDEVRRRARRDRVGNIFVIAASAAVVAGVVIGGWSQRDLGAGPGQPVGSPSSEDSTRPDLAPPTSPSATSVPDADPATQPIWDPVSVEAAPLRETKLPERIDWETAQGPTLQEQPMAGIVAALQDDTDLRLLDTDGTWRTVSLTANPGDHFGVDDVERPAISSDGTRVAVATEAGIRVIDATTGAEQALPWPQALAPPWDSPPNVHWHPGDDGFIIFDIVRTWLVELDGSSREAPYRSYALGIDPDGPVYQNDFQARTLLTWEGNRVVDESPFVQCERMVAGYGMVACTAGSLQPSRSGPVVVAPETGKIIAYAPIKDPHASYSDNGGLTLLGFLDANTLLMAIGPAVFNNSDAEVARFLASWQFRTGEFQRISTGDADIRSIAVAPSLVE